MWRSERKPREGSWIEHSYEGLVTGAVKGDFFDRARVTQAGKGVEP